MSLDTFKALLAAKPTWISPAEFGLLAIVAFCTNDNEGSVARPSLAFLSKRLCMDRRSVRRMVAKLERRGVLRRVEQGRGRRASRYQLSLVVTDHLVPADLGEDSRVLSEGTVGSSLGTEIRGLSDSTATLREDREDPSARTPGSSLRGLPGPPISNEEDRTKEISTAAAPRFPHLAKSPNGDNYHVILAIANELINTFGYTRKDEGDFIEATKERCALAHIAYEGNVVHRACTSALCASIVNSSGRHGTVTGRAR